MTNKELKVIMSELRVNNPSLYKMLKAWAQSDIFKHGFNPSMPKEKAREIIKREKKRESKD